MTSRQAVRAFGVAIAAATATAVSAYAIRASATWLTYGRPGSEPAGASDPLLDRFMPEYEVVERHHVSVNAPADVTFAVSKDIDMEASPVVRAIFKARQIVMGAAGEGTARPRGIVALTKSLGWGVLAEGPHEIVMGAVTQPWQGDVVFHALPPGEFAAFHEPDYVKIVWNLRADVVDASHSRATTETRVVTTDAQARAKFRRYWACVSPGVVLIRWVSIMSVKRNAERLVRDTALVSQVQ
jgi:hypothetical protein